MSRYTTPEMEHLWSDQATLRLWQRIESSLLSVQYDHRIEGIEENSANLVKRAQVSVEDWAFEIEKCGHEYNAFLRILAAQGVNQVHVGVTTSDITDTALSMRVGVASWGIYEAVADLREGLRLLNTTYGKVQRLGRTHGQAAIMTTCGHMFAVWDAALQRASDRLMRAASDARVCMASGPIGTYLHISGDVEADLAARLGLSPAGPTTQIVMRDRLADWVNALVIMMSVFEAIALELRLLSHSSINEILFDGPSSSSMPHKTNPSEFERISGLARLVRAAYEPIVSGVAVWHERDISHSSVEKETLPQITGIVHYTAVFLVSVFSTIEFLPSDGGDKTSKSHTVMTEIQLARPSLTHEEAQALTLLILNETREGVTLNEAFTKITHIEKDIEGEEQ